MRSPLVALFVLSVAACSSSDPEPSTPGGAGSGAGMATGGGGAGMAGGVSTSGAGGSSAGVSSGGASGGSSGAAGSGTAGGGSGSGGGGGSAVGFKCPVGSEAAMVTVPATAGSPVANVPPAGFDPDNLEGPVWINGSLYLSEIAKRASPSEPQGGRIIRYQPGVGATPFLTDVGTNGLAVTPEGDLLAASQKLGAVVSFDLSASTPSATPKKTYADMHEGKRFSSPNDVAMRSDGNVYFTDPAYQAGSVKQDAERAYRVTPGGMVSVIPGTMAPPNGIALSPDENTLYVGGAKLTKYPVMADGSLGAGADFPDQANGGALFGTDGLGVDCAGNLYVALYNEGTVKVVRPDGTSAGTITVGNGVTNVAFGGAEGKTLFITRMTPPSLYAVELNVVGLPY